MIIQTTTLDTEAKVKAIYGGTKWTKIEGRFLLGASSSYKINTTGGEATHKLTVDEMPSHNHSFPKKAAEYYPGADNTLGGSYATRVSGAYFSSTNNTGGGKAHNNMPPYKAVYIWERTA